MLQCLFLFVSYWRFFWLSCFHTFSTPSIHALNYKFHHPLQAGQKWPLPWKLAVHSTDVWEGCVCVCERELEHILFSLMVCFGPAGDESRQRVKFTDERVCKSHLLNCCPHDILSGTVTPPHPYWIHQHSHTDYSNMDLYTLKYHCFPQCCAFSEFV